VIWAKTDAGRIEMQARALVKERAQRNLLLVIDGVKSEEMLLSGLAGIGPDDFAALQSLGLIAPVTGGSRSAGAAASRGAAPLSNGSANPGTASPGAAPAAAEPQPLDYAQFTAALTQMISKELGLRGFVLTLAVEKAGTIAELQAVAQRTLAQIAERKGEAVAMAARRTLYGG
jgi:hypothetical protein